MTEQPSADALRHSLRFREVSTLYPRLVALAYGRDLAAAARDTDEQVAARVAAWQVEQGQTPRDWTRWGREVESQGR